MKESATDDILSDKQETKEMSWIVWMFLLAILVVGVIGGFLFKDNIKNFLREPNKEKK